MKEFIQEILEKCKKKIEPILCSGAGATVVWNDIKPDISEALAAQDKRSREEERGRCIEVVKTYGNEMVELQEEMMGTAHRDSKIMLAYDMHSRLIAVKHVINALTSNKE